MSSAWKTLGFVKVLSAKDLPQGKMLGIEAGGKQILMANIEGKYYAMGNKCTHNGCKLSGGTLKKGGVVQCPCHYSQFDIKTGNVVLGPAEKPEPLFQVKEDGDQLMVDA